MKKSKCLFGFLIASLIFTCAGCVGFQVASPKPTDVLARTNGFSTNANGYLVIPVVFTEPVDQSTVIVTKTLILRFSRNPNAAAILTWSPDSKNLTITTVDKRDDLMNFNPDDGFTLRLIGTDRGNGAVKSVKGILLDGDYDNNPGGNYLMGFFIIG